AQVAARLQPWIEMVEAKAQQMLAGSPLEALLPPREIAFAFVSLYLGIDMLSHLEGNQSRAESLLELGVTLATMAEALGAPNNLDLPTDQTTEA
ncbi:MAG: hypothetical protein JHC87_09950, partial [Thermoleophilaceae bacterium]|nr:hypothetical protein [Thermoleophilaceae bacterium]